MKSHWDSSKIIYPIYKQTNCSDVVKIPISEKQTKKRTQVEYGDLQFIERLGKGEFGEADGVTDFVGLGPGGLGSGDLWKGLLGVPLQSQTTGPQTTN